MKYKLAIEQAAILNERDALLELLRSGEPISADEMVMLADFIASCFRDKRGRPPARIFSETWRRQRAVEDVRWLTDAGHNVTEAINLVLALDEVRLFNRAPKIRKRQVRINRRQLEDDVRRSRQRRTK